MNDAKDLVIKKIPDSYEDMDGDELNFIEEYDDDDLKTQQLGVNLQCSNEDKTECNFDNVQQKKRRIENLIKDKFSVSDDLPVFASLDENIKQASNFILSVLEKNGDIKKRSRKRKATSPAKALTCVKQAIKPKPAKKIHLLTQSSDINENSSKNVDAKQKLTGSCLKVNSQKVKEIRPFVPVSIAPYRPFTAQVVQNGTSVLKPVIQYRLPVGQTILLKPNSSSASSIDNSQLKFFKPTNNVTSPSFLLPHAYNKKNDITSQSSMMVYLKDKKYRDICTSNAPSLRIVNGQPEYLAIIKKTDSQIPCKPSLTISNQFNHSKSKILVTMDTNKSINTSLLNKMNILSSTSVNSILTPKENNCEAFNKLFSNIQVDVTLPDIPDDLYLNDLKFFKCKACDVKFINKEDIQIHLQRVSVVLKFKCICGDQRSFLTFYNPCTFKIFYKSHISTASGSKHSTFKSVKVTPLDSNSQFLEFKSLETFKELENLKKQTKELLERKNLVNISDDECSIDDCTLYENSADGNQITYNVNDDVPCSVCSLKCNIFNGSYEKHFHNIKFNSSFQCKMCFRYLPSKCSYMAHINIHNLSKPYICPECGLLFNKSRPSFMNHVKNTCFHYTRYTTVRCKLCSEIVNFANYIKKHIIEKHSNNYFKCNSCNKAFILPTGFNKHNAKEHDNLAKSEEVSACPFCKIVISKQLIANHITCKHEGDELHGEMNNYRCCICEMNFVNNHEMLEHIQSKHSNIFPKELICLICNKPLMTIHSLLKHYASEHKIISEITEGSILIPLKKVSSNKRKSLKQTSLKTIVSDKIEIEDKTPEIITPNLNLECTVELTNCGVSGSKILSCTQCQATFLNEETYMRHIKRHNFLQNKIKTSKSFQELDKPNQEKNCKPKEKLLILANCHLCAMIFKNQDQLKIHMIHEHQEKSSNRNYNCSICKTDVKSFASLATLARHLKTSHRLTKEKIEVMKVQLLNENLPTNSQQILDVKNGAKSLKLFNSTGNYVCFWCPYQTPQRHAFSQHIRIHATSASHFQCTECGATYPLLSSLHRHLFAIHAVVDLKAYENEVDSKMADVEDKDGNDINDTTDEETLVEPKPLEKTLVAVGQKTAGFVAEKKAVKRVEEDRSTEFECNVCYKSFDDRNSLRMHMRVHGMAFIEGTKRTMMASSLNVSL